MVTAPLPLAIAPRPGFACNRAPHRRSDGNRSLRARGGLAGTHNGGLPNATRAAGGELVAQFFALRQATFRGDRLRSPRRGCTAGRHCANAANTTAATSAQRRSTQLVACGDPSLLPESRWRWKSAS